VGECSLAVAGGVTVLSTPGIFVEFSRQRGLARDGRCKAFGAGADGTGWAEGMGLLVLERLSDARRLGHRVLAVVRGSAANQDGASNGLTAPNGPSQERVIRAALLSAGLSPGEVDAVEAHGTGTALGDPIEAQALLATYGQGRADGPLWLGSLKSNIGHAQAAAGVGGVIKMVMAMRHGELPRTLYVDEPSPHVDWSAGQVELLRESRPWPAGERPRRAGVSSFGISGTNAHVVLEEAPPDAASPRTNQSGLGVVPWVVSARSESALHAQAERLRAHLAERPEIDPIDVAYSLACGRAQLEHRAVVLGRERDELLAGLGTLARGQPAASVIHGVAHPPGKIAFMFPGQGAQWPGMALDLWRTLPAFGERMDACADALAQYVDWSLEEVLERGSGSSFHRTDVVQPALFAVMVSLAGAWRAFGVEPSVVVGHSQGEIAAAHVAGALSLEDAARVVALRSQAVADELAGHGGMVAIGLPVEEIESRLHHWDGRIEVATINGPTSVVVAGDQESLEELLRVGADEGVRTRRVSVDYASHSPQVEKIRDRLLEDLAAIRPRSSEIPFFSAAVGAVVDGSALGAEYWYRSLRETVRFEQATRSLIQDGCRAFIEVSPHPVLTPAVEETIADTREPDGILVLQSLRDGDGGLRRFQASLAAAHVGGVGVGWGGLLGCGELVSLPSYAFQRRRFWLGGEGDSVGVGQVAGGHRWLGSVVALAGEDRWVLTGRVGLLGDPWLADHAVLDAVLFPGTGFVELAVAAGAQVGCEVVEELVLEAPLVLPEGGWVQLQVLVGGPDGGGRRELVIYSRFGDGAGEELLGGEWTRHAGGVISPVAAGGEAGVAALAGESWPPVGAEPVEVEFVYDRLVETGFGYGPAFQGLGAAWRRGEEIFAEVSLAEEQAVGAEQFGIHPALFDAALHAGFLHGDDPGLRLPFSWAGVRLFGTGASSLRVRMVPAGGGAMSLAAVDEVGRPVLSLDSLAMRPLDRDQAGLLRSGHDSLFSVEWSELTGSWGEDAPSRVVVLGGIELGGAGVERYPDLGALVAGIDAGVPVPELVLVQAPGPLEAEGLVDGAHRTVQQVLALLQGWLAQERLADSRLALVTAGAVAVTETEAPTLREAPLWGLVRSAQSEHPGRFLLIDSDSTEASRRTLPAALATGEPQLAIRHGTLHTPQLTRIEVPERVNAQPLGSGGTVLVTGGTGGLGGLVARGLAERGAERLLLVSRRGGEAEGAGALRAGLAELGCEARLVACDVADREQLVGLLDSIPAEFPLTGVVHAAGVLEDGVIETLDPRQLERVLRPKLDAAVLLHELTERVGVREFVLFSSAAAAVGSPGQGNYAAANAFLDALAQHRRVCGLPAVSLAWGLWAQASGMTDGLSEADRARMARAGMLPLSERQGLDWFELGRSMGRAVVLPMRLDGGALRARARDGMLPPLLRGLVRVPARRAQDAAGSLTRRLAGVPESEWEGVVLELVRSEIAVVLGHASPDAVEPERAFKDLGFDSLGAVELRNRLATVTGLPLPSTLVFDHPNAKAAAGHICSRIDGRPSGTDHEGRVQQAIASIPIPRLQEAGLLDVLLELANPASDPVSSEPDQSYAGRIDDMELDELVQSALPQSAKS
jgi:acyl transferase domain-containing protein/acyl carrier protein